MQTRHYNAMKAVLTRLIKRGWRQKALIMHNQPRQWVRGLHIKTKSAVRIHVFKRVGRGGKYARKRQRHAAKVRAAHDVTQLVAIQNQSKAEGKGAKALVEQMGGLVFATT